MDRNSRFQARTRRSSRTAGIRFRNDVNHAVRRKRTTKAAVEGFTGVNHKAQRLHVLRAENRRQYHSSPEATGPCIARTVTASEEKMVVIGEGIIGRDGRCRTNPIKGISNGNERRVESMVETTRKIVGPTAASSNWRCSDCAWSQPFVRRQQLVPNVPSKAIEDAFNRHKCTEHRPPKWNR